MALDRAAILAARDIQTEAVDIPEWGGTVHVRTLSAKERLDLAPAAKSGDLTFELAFLALSDEHGRRLLTDADRDDFAQRSGDVIQRIALVALRLNRMRKEDMEADAKKYASEPT